MDGSFKPITEVQEAEGKAAKLIEKANRDRESAMVDAKGEAVKLVQSAEERAKKEKADSIANSIQQLERRKSAGLEAAEREAKAYKAKRLNKTEKARVVRELVELILGA